MIISHENENQFLIFVTVYHLIDPNVITLYGKKNFKILTNFTPTRFFETNSQNGEIL